MNLFAPGLLDGRTVAVAGRVPDPIVEALEDLGARVEPMAGLDANEDAVGDWARAHAPLDALVYDGGTSFAAGGPDRLVQAMDEAWMAVREVAVGALIDGDRPGKIVLVGPPLEVGAQAVAAQAALENLARTLSVEWARHGVTAVMVAPGERSQQAGLAEVICFLCSRAGEYFSGCRIRLGP